MPAAERMSRVDTAWLRMDNDVNQMMIVGVWLLQPRISLAALRERVADKLLKYDRFRQRVVHDAVGALWVDDEDFELDRHLFTTTLTRQEGQTERQALQHLCGLLAGIPLDSRYPRWQFQLIEDFEGGSALIMRVHHCIGDGVALVSVMLSLTDGGADPPPRRAKPAQADDDADWLADAVLKPLTDITLKAIGATGDGVARTLDALSHPEALLGNKDAARAGLQVMQDVAALALMPDDSHTPLKGRPLGVKHVAWCEPLPLSDVKAVSKALGCSINDVLLSCAAGAFGQWLRDKGHDTRSKAIRAMVPVNLRPLDKAWQLGNRFGLAPLVLPIGIDNPVERVFDVHQRMSAMKTSYQPLLAFAVLSVSGLFVKPVQDSILGLFAKKSTAVMTNVPGPAQALTLCGSTLRQSLFWVPASGDIGVGVSILSYAGGVQFGLITDEHMCNSPQEIADRFAQQFEVLLLTTLMLPWPGQDAAP
jgi:diacylglycerol O-acyltransferase / wax synthase